MRDNIILKLLSTIIFIFCFGEIKAQLPSISREVDSKFVDFSSHTTSNDFISTAQVKIGSYLTLGNFGHSNHSWIGSNIILDYSSYNGLGSQGNTNRFIPIWANGTGLLIRLDYTNGSFQGLTHSWAGQNQQVDISQFSEVWRLDKDKNYFKGNIGIGRESRANIALDVEGRIIGTDFIEVQKNGSYRIAMNGQTHGYIVGRNDSGLNTLMLSTSGNSFFNGGNVGIGTTNPGSYKLAVNGNIRAKEVRVEATGWPDYVFEENYPLMDLSQLESYIKANKHLPEIPSAEEVETNGIELGEMNKLLLQKIEELTLYTIEQEKVIKQLDQQNQKIVNDFAIEISNLRRDLLEIKNQLSEN